MHFIDLLKDLKDYHKFLLTLSCPGIEGPLCQFSCKSEQLLVSPYLEFHAIINDSQYKGIKTTFQRVDLNNNFVGASHTNLGISLKFPYLYSFWRNRENTVCDYFENRILKLTKDLVAIV